MTNEQKIIAIAEACGWKLADETRVKERAGNAAWLLSKGPWWINDKQNKIAVFVGLPDYINDLNAMHEAEKVLLTLDSSAAHWESYSNRLVTLMGCTDIFHATASQRAESFLKTIGKLP